MTLSELEQRWLVTIVESILPSDAAETLSEGAEDAPILPLADDLLLSAPGDVGWAVRLGVWFVFVFGPMWILRQPALFGSLKPKLRVKVLDGLSKSSVYWLREIPVLLKLVGTLAFCALPAVHKQLGSKQATRLPRWARD